MMNESEHDEMLIVSACLAGIRCVNYPSYVMEDEVVKQLVADGKAIPLCPEQMGGLPTPRPPAGFLGGESESFWTGAGEYLTRVVSTEGDDFSEPFLRGPREILRVAKLVGATKAILQDGSPSCGVTRTSVYAEDGNLVHRPGSGALTWLLRSNGIKVYTPTSWKKEVGTQLP
jgi:uncharacterized protein YbbK (DUF523 family)